MGVRLPTILGKAIDDVVRTLNEQSDEDKVKDLVACIERMEDLMEDLQKNSELRRRARERSEWVGGIVHGNESMSGSEWAKSQPAEDSTTERAHSPMQPSAANLSHNLIPDLFWSRR